jgi:S-formylglutathione hydrolase FrmB
MRRCLGWLSFFLVPLVVCVVFPGQARAQGRTDCNSMHSRILGESVHYCVMLPPNYDTAVAGHPVRNSPASRSYPVLYFLHGLGDNEQTFLKSGGWDLVEDLRQQGEISEFLIVVPEGKRGFYINSFNGRVRYSDFFIHEFMPYVESHYSIRRERSARGISGVSMGGYGALRFAFADPELFSSVSAESAALITESPRELDAMHGPGPLDRELGAVFGNPIDLRHWNQNSPFVLATQNRKLIRADGLAIYFNCGDEDELGFDKGAEALHKQLLAEGIQHEFHLYPGNHGADFFLSHLGEVLKFHSRAFGATK